MRTSRSQTRRKGFSLIEMVLVIGGVTAILGMVGGLVHILLRLDRHGRNYLNDSTTISRLSDQLRSDVRSADEAKTSEDAAKKVATLALTMPDTRVVDYSWQGTTLTRKEQVGGKDVRHEQYHVDRLGPIRFEVKDGFVKVVIGREPDVTSAAFRSRIGVEAKIGKRRPLTQVAEKKP